MSDEILTEVIQRLKFWKQSWKASEVQSFKQEDLQS